MEWTENGLRAEGFEGFVGLLDLARDTAPADPGVYVVVRPNTGPPSFLAESPAGRPKGRNPTVAESILRTAWVDGAHVVYIGKAGSGARGRRGLRRRLTEYRRHGAGEPVGHLGWAIHLAAA